MMVWRYPAFLAMSLALPGVSAAQSQPQQSLVPQGMLADRNALSAMDYIEIEQLYARYAASLDLGDGAARATTFTPDGTFANIVRNHEPISLPELVERTNRTGNIGDRHMTLHLVITPTEAGANGFAYTLKVDRHQKVYTGFYNDTLVRTPDGWRFKTREVWHDTEPNSPYHPKPEVKAGS
jgi:hypothetical protein